MFSKNHRSLKRQLKKILAAIYHPIIAGGLFVLFCIVGFFPLSFLRKTAHFLGKIFYFLLPKYRKLAKENIRIAKPDVTTEEIKRLVPRVYASGILLFLEMAWMAANPKKIKEFIDIPPEFQQSLRQTGCFAVTPHLGNWELLAQAAIAYQIPMAAIAKELANPYLYRLILSLRTRNGLEIIDSAGAVRQFIKVIKQHRPVGILIDQALPPRKGGIFIRFFNLPATCSRSVATMALKLKVPVFICACIRTKKGFRFIQEKLSKPISEFTDDIELTQEIIKCNEVMIRNHLEDYSWFYPRWRYIPEDCSEEDRARFPSYAVSLQKKENN